MPVTLDGELKEAAFVNRPNRFVVNARIGRRGVKAHLPNPGRLEEFLHEGTPFLLRKRPAVAAEAATRWSVVAAQHQGHWVLLDTHITNELIDDGLRRGTLRGLFPDALGHRRGVTGKHGRFDFQLDTPRGPQWLEAKSVSLLADDGHTGLFPDAPTTRGTRHLAELMQLVEDGQRAAVVLVALREDIRAVQANRATDPAFADALERAYKRGVQVAAWGTRVKGDEVSLTRELPVVFG